MRNSSEEREEYLVPYRRVNRPQSWRISYPTLSKIPNIQEVYNFYMAIIKIKAEILSCVLEQLLAAYSNYLNCSLSCITQERVRPFLGKQALRHMVHSIIWRILFFYI